MQESFYRELGCCHSKELDGQDKKKSKVKGCARVFQRGLAQFSAFHRIAFLFVKTSLLFCIRHPSSFLPFCRANQARSVAKKVETETTQGKMDKRRRGRKNSAKSHIHRSVSVRKKEGEGWKGMR